MIQSARFEDLCSRGRLPPHPLRRYRRSGDYVSFFGSRGLGGAGDEEPTKAQRREI